MPSCHSRIDLVVSLSTRTLVSGSNSFCVHKSCGCWPVSCAFAFQAKRESRADSHVRRSGWHFIRQQSIPELHDFNACREKAFGARTVSVPAHDRTNLMLDASVSL